ncbi:MAG: hypothetical protein M1831_000779 [Alyxoria varia]|nr:MAG: hypothetical protein M1831_000779 [Alyxoria varia]
MQFTAITAGLIAAASLVTATPVPSTQSSANTGAQLFKRADIQRIDCEGSASCAGYGPANGWAITQDLKRLTQEASEKDSGRVYESGQNVACVKGGFGNGVCAWFWGRSGTAGEAAEAMESLQPECAVCGNLHWEDDVMFSTNHVGDTGGCDGVC